MTLRAFRKRPPFPIPDRARATDLPCDPKISQRGTHPMYFPELAMCPGPEAIGVTGDNRFETLYGREWAILFCDDERLFFLQWDDGGGIPEGLVSSGWAGVPEPLLTLPTFTGSERAFTIAFDQSARIIYAYELNGFIKVTRWDASQGEYRQNVDFAGRDPTLLIDAALADPRGYPTNDADGWSVREAYDAGIRVLFEWIPDGVFRDTAIPDSDVLLFYLSPDRERVMARVQREVYAVERLIHDFGTPVVLDYAVALPGRYQLQVSSVIGTPLTDVLVSVPYLGDFIINPQQGDAAGGSLEPETIDATQWIVKVPAPDLLAATASPETIDAVANIYRHTVSEPVDASVVPETVDAVAMIYAEVDTGTLDASVTLETVEAVALISPSEASDALTGSLTPETVRVQTV